MSKLIPPLYVKPTHPKGDVLAFGKEPRLERSDNADGLARFGGQWRTPSYLLAYLRASDVLVEYGQRSSTLDDIALPAFYMQRHALELLVKRLLSWTYEYAQLKGDEVLPSKTMLRTFRTSHNISGLFENLKQSCHHFGFTAPPVELGLLIADFARFEKSETWARYERSESKDGAVTRHVESETVLPIVSLQKELEKIAANALHRFDGTPAYEDELYYAWLDEARAAGKAG